RTLTQQIANATQPFDGENQSPLPPKNVFQDKEEPPAVSISDFDLEVSNSSDLVVTNQIRRKSDFQTKALPDSRRSSDYGIVFTSKSANGSNLSISPILRDKPKGTTALRHMTTNEADASSRDSLGIPKMSRQIGISPSNSISSTRKGKRDSLPQNGSPNVSRSVSKASSKPGVESGSVVLSEFEKNMLLDNVDSGSFSQAGSGELISPQKISNKKASVWSALQNALFKKGYKE
ncbi:hypothetical protein HDU99_006790, partial [Rhizoclosmatium hyalinum]